MKKREYKKLHKKLNKLFMLWITRLGLRWWKVSIHYVDDKKTIDKYFIKDDIHHTLAMAFSDWKYGNADIYVNMKDVQHRTDEELEEIVIHECMHLLVNEMRAEGIDHEERVVTTLTRAVQWTVADVEKKNA